MKDTVTKEARPIAYHSIVAKLPARSRRRCSTVERPGDNQTPPSKSISIRSSQPLRSPSLSFGSSLMLDELASGMSNIKGKGRKPGSEGSAGAIPRVIRSEMKETVGDMGKENETKPVTLLNDSHLRIRYTVFHCVWVVRYHRTHSSQ